MDITMTDRKGLIREAFRIDGITKAECCTIFLDWALSLPDGLAPRVAISNLLKAYEDQPDDHPMTAVLQEGLAQSPEARRRGGRAARLNKA